MSKMSKVNFDNLILVANLQCAVVLTVFLQKGPPPQTDNLIL